MSVREQTSGFAELWTGPSRGLAEIDTRPASFHKVELSEENMVNDIQRGRTGIYPACVSLFARQE